MGIFVSRARAGPLIKSPPLLLLLLLPPLRTFATRSYDGGAPRVLFIERRGVCGVNETTAAAAVTLAASVLAASLVFSSAKPVISASTDTAT